MQTTTLQPPAPTQRAASDGFDLEVADYFCGAGGSSSGMEQVPGIRVRMAANHWQLAVDTHNANLPHADHDIADISGIDPHRHPRTDVAWFSPECTNWSVAKGVKVDYDGKPEQLDMFAEDEEPPLPDEAAHRSRMLMQDVPRFTEVHRYRAVLVENVTDVLKWEHLSIWIMRMRNLGYKHKILVLNSAFATALGNGAPQDRNRVYFVFWRNEYPDPDFAKWTRPRAWCPRCETNVQGVMVDKKPGKLRPMRYGAQYFYRCPSVTCRGAAVHPYALPAAAAINWSIPGQRIGDRSRELAPKTFARIEAGLLRDTSSMLVPLEGRDGKQARSIDLPLRAQTARHQDALVIPLRNNGVARRAAAHPLVTFAAGGTHQGLLMRPGTDGAQMPTPPGAGQAVWDHVLLPYDARRTRSLDLPLPAQTTVQGDALLGRAVDVENCTFRMLGIEEINDGMAFRRGYVLLGTKREKVRMLGNAVTPPVARDLVAAVAEVITGRQIDPVS